MCTFVVATPILRLVLYALTDDTIITYQELYQAITKKQPESIEVYRIKAQIQRPAPLLRTVTAYRSQAHALTAEKQALQCGGGYFANLTSVSSPELANVPGAMQLPART
ncbi:hypothetical protein VLQ41_004675 [Salmonella enterica]|nr:hypothetical protein [Salmonella enterica]EJW3950177.1 hypothetical protein [Salmonella enterica]EJW6909663.1 hypothetical protein [Salmonella enterica]EMC8577646.1 hypothetical protein [Salmonella enterica]EME8513600.1 hypothetical protein [Salmonella enterica]